jgi:hypothetical protein
VVHPLVVSRLTVTRVNERVCRVLDEKGQHVGNLKLIGALWKFNAIVYDECGAVVPGGSPLTDRRNTTFAALDTNATCTGTSGSCA